VNSIEVARSQLEGLPAAAGDHATKKASDELKQKLIAIEENLVELQARGRGGSKLARKLSYLASELASSDFKPTNQQLDVQKLLEERLATCQGQFDALRARDLPALKGVAMAAVEAISQTYVVSAFRRTVHGPAKAGHYVRD